MRKRLREVSEQSLAPHVILLCSRPPSPWGDRGRIRIDGAPSLESLFDLRQATRSRLALAAVIEQKNGSLSYWTLAHPPQRPDFHQADAFSQVFERSGVLGYRRL